MNTEPGRNTWRVAGPSVALLLLLVFGLYHSTLFYLVGLWNQLEIGEYAHGYLVLAISGYLILRNRPKLSALTPCPSNWALLAVAAAGLLWTLAALVDIQMLQAVSLLMLVLATVWAVLGNRVTRALAFPLLFIGFAIPIWFPLSPFLQDVTADVVFWGIRLLQIPAFRQENLIVLPAGSLSIEEACSGLRYLLAALTLGTLYAYLYYQSLRARLLVVLISAGAAVLANMVRVFIVVYLGYTSEMQHPFVEDHLSLGWYLFGGLVVILLILDAQLSRYFQSAAPSVAVENQARSTVCSKGLVQYVGIITASLMLVAAGPGAIYWINHQAQPVDGQVELVLPSGSGGWAGPFDSEDDWIPQYPGAMSQKQAYRKEKERVFLYLGYYPAQKQDAEVINDLNRISNKDVWQTRYPRGRSQRTDDDQPVLEQLLEKRGDVLRLVWYWYRVAGRQTTNKYEAKLLQVLGLVSGRPQAAVVAVAVETGGDLDRARQVLREFVSAMNTALVKVVDKGTHRSEF